MDNIEIRCLNVIEATSQLHAQRGRQLHRRFCFYRTRSPKELMLVDPKPYAPPNDPQGDGAVENARDIVRLLQAHGPDELGTLRCRAFFEDPGKEQIYFAFYPPPGCNEHSVFCTLHEYLGQMRPSVTARMALARFLAKSLLRTHERGFYHKGIRSDSVLFFRRSLNEARSIEEPYLAGFDFARKASPDKFSETFQFGHQVFYRHPKALSDPDTSFRRTFDYYSLGIVLVEIALWRQIKEILSRYAAFQTDYTRTSSIVRIKDIILGEDAEADDYPREIAFHMGDRFFDVVKLCVSGGFGSNLTGEALVEEFKERVVRPLERCIV